MSKVINVSAINDRAFAAINAARRAAIELALAEVQTAAARKALKAYEDTDISDEATAARAAVTAAVNNETAAKAIVTARVNDVLVFGQTVTAASVDVFSNERQTDTVTFSWEKMLDGFGVVSGDGQFSNKLIKSCLSPVLRFFDRKVTIVKRGKAVASERVFKTTAKEVAVGLGDWLLDKSNGAFILSDDKMNIVKA